MTCTKRIYNSRQAALTAGHRIRWTTFDFGCWCAYRCSTCKKPNGQQAWHWGHNRKKANR